MFKDSLPRWKIFPIRAVVLDRLYKDQIKKHFLSGFNMEVYPRAFNNVRCCAIIVHAL